MGDRCSHGRASCGAEPLAPVGRLPLLSGVATGVSWLAYFRALQLAPASRVGPIDELSLPLAIVLAAVFLGEAVGWRLGLGVALMTIGAILTISA